MPTRKLGVIFDAYDVVVVPFPFTDRAASKRRPAVVLSSRKFNDDGQLLLAMITSATDSSWAHDTPVSDLASAGLAKDCVVRMKMFTLDARLVLRKAGTLAARDRQACRAALDSILAA